MSSLINVGYRLLSLWDYLNRDTYFTVIRFQTNWNFIVILCWKFRQVQIVQQLNSHSRRGHAPSSIDFSNPVIQIILDVSFLWFSIIKLEILNQILLSTLGLINNWKFIIVSLLMRIHTHFHFIVNLLVDTLILIRRLF